MAQPVIQTSFVSGEWAPALNARVDLQKYHSGAALLRNFFVDYRGGATTRPGTKYILQTRSSATVRLIPFQASFTVTYILEFGQGYIRFFNNGNPVLENAKTITGITQANPGVVTSAAHGYANGDWVFISNVGGMTQVNGNYYIVAGAAANTFQLTDLNGNAVNTTAFGAYTAGGTVQRVYTLLTSPYQSGDVFAIKYAQNVNILVLTHPNYPPYQLVLNSATNWTLSAITFGSTVAAPGGLASVSSAAAGSGNVSYVVTSVDVNGQESGPSTVTTLTSKAFQTPPWTNSVTWTAVPAAASYNIYRTNINYAASPPAGSQYGFVGNVVNTAFFDTNIAPDFSLGPPIPQNPFAGSGVQSIIVSNPGSYAGGSTVPSITLTGGGGAGATAIPQMTGINGTVNFTTPGNAVGFTYSGPFGIIVQCTSVDGSGRVLTFAVISTNVFTSGTLPNNPFSLTGGPGGAFNLQINLNWGVTSVGITSPGTGYATPPAVNFSSGAAAATAVLGAPSAGNPTVPGFFQQRMFLGGPILSPSQFNFSQPGAIYNFNTTFPVQADNAIQATLTNTTLNTIQSVVPVPAGLIVIADKGAWLLNGGSAGSGLSALDVVANQQAYSGGNGLPPIVTPNDILYVQSKGSIVRDLAYNFYVNNYTGADISVISSHLFYGFQIVQWAFAEEPFKLVWAVRNDGNLLSLTFVKEQELIAWAHSDTQGAYTSVAAVTEATSIGNVDATYLIAQRTVNGLSVKYIERMVELNYPQGYISSWQVDAGIGYNGSPAVTFQGAQHLAGLAVTGLADGVVINFTMPASGIFVFGGGGTPGLTGIPSASVVTVGLAFVPQLGTLAADLGEPTVQGKRKNVSAVNIRVRQALGLSAGKSLSAASQKPMKDLVLGNVGTQSNAIVTDLVTSDARIILEPQFDVFGSFFFQQSNPFPASILGVMPEISVGDTPK